MAAQIAAVLIFLVMFLLIIMDKIERHIITLACAVVTMVVVFGICMHSMTALTETLNVSQIFTRGFWYTAGEASESSAGINWATIIFVAGMMIMVEGMAAAGFFRWLCMTIAKAVKYKVIPIFITFMFMSSILAMFIDSITVILFLAAVTLELADLLDFDPVPMVLAEIFCANLGGSATMCGDPPNIIVGTSLQLTFADFITNTGVLAGISLILVVIYYYLIFHKELRVKRTGKVVAEYPDPKSAITNKKSFAISTVIFLCAVVLLVTHAQTGLTVATIGLGIAIVTLITSGKNIVKVIKGVDYKTLLFFIGLFVVVGGLEQTNVLKLIAEFIGSVSGGNLYVMVAIIIWVSAIASAFVDNIPFAADNGSCYPEPGSPEWCEYFYTGMGTFHGNRYRRKRNTNRSISECSRYVGYRKRRSHRWMGQILQECSSGNNYRNGGCNSRNLAQILLMERNVIVWN